MKKVYVVITSNDCEVRGEVEGVFTTHKKAVTKFNEIKDDWLTWAEGDDIEENEEKDFYCLTDNDVGEYMEVKIVEAFLE